MAVGGQKAKPRHLKLIDGNPGCRPIQDEPEATGVPVMPHWLTDKRAIAIWHDVMTFAHWLSKAESYKLASWCDRQADFERDRKEWSASDRREHRTAGSELGFDPMSRARMGSSTNGQKQADPAEKYFTA